MVAHSRQQIVASLLISTEPVGVPPLGAQSALPLPVIVAVAEAGIEVTQLSSLGRLALWTPQASSLKSVVVAAQAGGAGAAQAHGEQPRVSSTCSRWCCSG